MKRRFGWNDDGGGGGNGGVDRVIARWTDDRWIGVASRTRFQG